MSFTKLAKVLDFSIKKDTIRTALFRKGFYRYLAIYKPLIIGKNWEI